MALAPVLERLLTAEEFAETCDPPGMTTELVRGRIVTMPPAKTMHGSRGSLIDGELRAFARRHRLGLTTGEGGYVLARDPDTVRAPDAAFIESGRIPDGGVPEDAYLAGAPTLAVEVVSSSDRARDVADKVRDWLAAGASRVWEVRPKSRTVLVHRPGAGPVTRGLGDTLTSSDAGFTVDGFALPVSEIFAP